jgi:hypothetical protein
VREEKRGDVERLAAEQLAVPDGVMGLLADDEQLALERVGVGTVWAALDEGLANDRFGGPHAATQAGVVGGHVAPAQQNLALGGNSVRSRAASLWPRGRQTIARQENHSHGIIAESW